MSVLDIIKLEPGSKPVRDHLEERNIPIFTSDPATFLVAASILNKVRESVSELKAVFAEAKPELEVVVENVLSRMTMAGLIDVVKDKVVILRRTPHIDLRKAEYFEFLPKVMSIVAKRIQKNCASSTKERNDEVAFYSLPDHPKVRRRVLEITDRYLAELGNLEKEIQNDSLIVAERVRFCLVMTGNLEPEDF